VEVKMQIRKIALRCALAWLVGSASMVSAVAADNPTTSAAQVETSKPYRLVGAQHLYDAYQQRVYKGQLPPLLYAIAITETEIDENGNVLSAVVTREPAAAKEVGPWVISLIQAASPFPKPGRAGRTRYQDIWLVDRSYTFQLDTLTEGQR
jgi:protein TonB